MPLGGLTHPCDIDSPNLQGEDHSQKRIQEIVDNTYIPLRGNRRIHFLEALHALAGRVAGAELPPDEEFVVHNRMIQSLPKVRRHMPMNI